MGVIRETVLRLLKENRKQGAITVMKMIGLDGGEGSGNFGHAGRPGEVGGSAPEGGGGGSGSESSESKSFFNVKGFKDIAQKAYKNRNDFKKFLHSLTHEQNAAIIDQHKFCGTTEKPIQYAERLYNCILKNPDMAYPHGKVKSGGQTVDGKNILESYEKSEMPYTNQFGQVIDTTIEDVLEKQGYMGVPKVVDEAEFERIMIDHPEMPLMFRSYSAPNRETLSQYDSDLESGAWYVDCGVGGSSFGKGMYSVGTYEIDGERATSFVLDEVRDYKRQGEMRFDWMPRKPIVPEGQTLVSAWYEDQTHYYHFNMDDGHSFDEKPEGIIATWTEAGDRKVWYASGSKLLSLDGQNGMSYEEAKSKDLQWAKIDGSCEEEKYEPCSSVRKMTMSPDANIVTYKELESRYREYRADASHPIDDVGSFAAALGYDAVDCGQVGSMNKNYIVVLNRTKLIVSEQKVSV